MSTAMTSAHAPRPARLRNRRSGLLLRWLLIAASPVCPAIASQPPGTALEQTIAALDGAVFDSFNRCAEPAQLARHASHFDPAVEFYHDTGGVTFSREAMLANTARHACGNYTRQLLAGSLEVFAIHQYGALARGRHRFCDITGNHCQGEAEFVMLWRQQRGRWLITRVLSYGHRALATTVPPHRQGGPDVP